MSFGDVKTEIVPKGVISTLGDGSLRITVPTTFENSVTSTHLSGAQLPIVRQIPTSTLRHLYASLEASNHSKPLSPIQDILGRYKASWSDLGLEEFA